MDAPIVLPDMGPVALALVVVILGGVALLVTLTLMMLTRD